MKIIFQPVNVFVEYKLIDADTGLPVALPEGTSDDLMKLKSVDRADDGYGTFPAEIIFTFDHPKDCHASSLIAMQQEVLNVIEKHLAYDAPENHQPVAGAEMGEHGHFRPMEE